MKFVVKQAGAPVDQLVELSIDPPDMNGWVLIRANGSHILSVLPDGTVDLGHLSTNDRALGFQDDTDGCVKVRGRKPA